MSDWSRLALCPECGAANPADAASCVRCGIRLQQAIAKFEAVRLARIERERARVRRISCGELTVAGQSYRFDEVTCRLAWEVLSIEADGSECSFGLLGIPFAGAASYSVLAGRNWTPDACEMAREADVLEDGGLWIGGERLDIRQISVECGPYDARQETLAVVVTMSIADARSCLEVGKRRLYAQRRGPGETTLITPARMR